MDIIHKIDAIHLLGKRISGYLVKQGIKTITLIGNSELIRIVCIDLVYSDEILISEIYADDIKATCNLNFLDKSLRAHRAFENNMAIEDDFVLVCTEKSNEKYTDRILKIKEAETIELCKAVEDWYADSYYYSPLEKIKNKNPNTPICILHGPYAGNVKNKSENERNLVANKVGIGEVCLMLKSSPPEIPEAIKRYNSDLSYATNITEDRKISKINGIYKLNDKATQYVNIIDGFRVTTDQPEKYDGVVYMFGHSVVYGRGAEDKDTIQSHLQRIFNKYARKNNLRPKLVMNCSNISSIDYIKMFPLINSFIFNKNDIIVIPEWRSSMINNDRKLGFLVCETQQSFDRPHDLGEVFIDGAVHLNSEGNKKVAECLFKTFEEYGLLSGEYKGISDAGNSFESADIYAEELHEYKTMLSQTHMQIVGKIGSIVMNCNPFTLGHRYLIEQAASQVRHLYIFAVEEDKSIFSFKDRIELIKAGTSDLPNVTVLPSGRFIISSLTFKDYFDKAELQDQTIDPSVDVSLFAKEIAPVLNITARFAGEEPLDMVTKQYNDTMRRILPDYGIEFIEIARKESDGEVISASRVRKLLEEKDFDAIAKIVPKTTMEYLVHDYLDNHRVLDDLNNGFKAVLKREI